MKETKTQREEKKKENRKSKNAFTSDFYVYFSLETLKVPKEKKNI